MFLFDPSIPNGLAQIDLSVSKKIDQRGIRWGGGHVRAALALAHHPLPIRRTSAKKSRDGRCHRGIISSLKSRT